MRNVTIVSIADHTLVSTGESQAVLTMERESGETFQLPLNLEDAEMDALLGFLFATPDWRSGHDETPEYHPPVLEGQVDPHYQEEPYVVPPDAVGYQGDEGDFVGGNGIEQF